MKSLNYLCHRLYVYVPDRYINNGNLGSKYFFPRINNAVLIKNIYYDRLQNQYRSVPIDDALHRADLVWFLSD